MFKLIITLSVVANVGGVMEATPAGQLKGKSLFETEKTCMEYIGTDAGKELRLLVEGMLERSRGLVAAFYCIKDGAPGSDI